MNTQVSLRKRIVRTVSIALVVLLLAFASTLLVACKTGGNLHQASVTEDFKTEYFVGDSFEEAGGLKLYTDATTFSVIPVTEDMISDFDTSMPGEVIIKIKYGDFVATVPIHVYPLNALTLTLDEETLPAIIYQNHPFPSGVTLSALMSNGATVDNIPVTASMLGAFDSSQLGPQTVMVGYGGAMVNFTLTIKADQPVTLGLEGAKGTYAVRDSLSIDDASLNLLWESGDVSHPTLTTEMVSNFSTALGGSFAAKITYGDLQCDYNYFVQKQATAFSLNASTLPTIFEKGDAFPSGGTGVLDYDDGTSETVSLTAANAPTFSTVAAGDKTVDIVVSGLSDSYSYAVLPGIESATPYGFTPAVMKGTAFDGLGKLVVCYENDQQDDIPFKNDDRLRIDYSTTEEGDIAQTVTFRGRAYTFTVHVYPESERNAVDHLEIAGVFRPIKLGDPLDVTGVQVCVVYKYLSPVTADCDPAWASAQMPSAIEGDREQLTVLISCFGAQTESSVTVLSTEYAARVTALSAAGFKTLYSVGDELSLENVTLTATLGGGYQTQSGIEPEASWITGFDPASAGEKTMTLTYGEYALQIPYRVIDDADKTRVTDVDISGFTPLLFVGDDITDIDVSNYTLSLTLGYGFATSAAPLEAEMLSGGPFDSDGLREVVLTYDGVQKTLYVTVHPAEDKQRVTSIEASGSVTAYVGSQPDLSGVSLVLTYGYGYAADTIAITSAGVSIDAFQNDREGMVRATVRYADCSCGLFINFVSGEGSNVLQSVEIEAGSKTEFTKGESLSGVRLILRYRSGQDVVDVTTDMAPDFDTAQTGSYSITVSYGGKGAMYNYTVTEASGQGQL